jgi:hypothetical protein
LVSERGTGVISRFRTLEKNLDVDDYWILMSFSYRDYDEPGSKIERI